MATTIRHAARRSARASRPLPASNQRLLGALWLGFSIVALLLLELVHDAAYGVTIVGLGAACLWASQRLAPALHWMSGTLDRRDIASVVGSYAVVVALFTLAFRVFTQDATLGLFLSFAAGMVGGVAWPVYYTVWLRRRPLASLGLTAGAWRRTAGLAVLLAGVQFALTLWGYDLPADAVDWVPLAVMALTVGLFEAIYFRGFVQGRLEDSLGLGPGVLLAAALYALYHVGYGMAGAEMTFLLGLGIVYAAAYRLAGSVLVLWPLLLPMGSFFNNLDSSEIELPWAAILGFVDVLALMATVLVIARRRERRAGVVRRSAEAPRRRHRAR